MVINDKNTTVGLVSFDVYPFENLTTENAKC